MTDAGPKIRQATIHDLETIVPLFDAYRQFYECPSEPQRARNFLRDRFQHRESIILLAFDAAGAAVGFVQLYPLFSSVSANRKYLLNDLYVTPEARRMGAAKALLTTAAEFAHALGAASLSLSTAVDNTPAQRLYESLGWAREQRFYDYHLGL